MKRPTRKALVECARLEIAAWTGLSRGLVIAILFCFIHRFIEGEPIEASYPSNASKPTEPEYFI